MRHRPSILRPTTQDIEAVRLQTDKARLETLGGPIGSREEMASRMTYTEWADKLPRPTPKEERDFIERTENKAHAVVMSAAVEILEIYRTAKESLGAEPRHVIAALQLTDSVAAEREALLATFGPTPS